MDRQLLESLMERQLSMLELRMQHGKTNKLVILNPDDADQVEALGNALCVRAANLRRPLPMKDGA